MINKFMWILQGDMETGDMIATEVKHFDVDATEFAYEIGQVPQMPAAYKSDEELQKLASENKFTKS